MKPVFKLLSSVLFLMIFLAPASRSQNLKYNWLLKYDPGQSIEARVPVPRDYVRVPVAPGGFQDWLRRLPLKPGRPEVRLFNGNLKANQSAHFAVLDLDLGAQDLQQCADSIIRLRAEYLYSVKDYSSIHFNFTSGDEARFDQYAKGYRPVVIGNYVRWTKSAQSDDSYSSFRNYLDLVFKYAGSYSLSKEMLSVKSLNDLQIGDVFIRGGFPGHAIIVVDLAENPETKDKIFLLAQGYIPAQEMHLLNNFTDSRLSPYYSLNFGEKLETPEYSFDRSELKKFTKSGSEMNPQ